MRRLFAVLAFGGLMVFQALSTSVAFAVDSDGDHVDDAVDVCPSLADPFQGDIDGDGVGDLCETGTTGVSNFEGTPEGELVIGTDGADTLSGAGGDDALYGLDGDDTLDGGDGRDLLSGGAGSDTLTGGAGCDTFAFDPSGDDDVITDFDVATDRMSFPSAAAESTDPAPTPTFGGDDDLVVTFSANNEQTATLEFQGLPAGVEISLVTGPCASPEPFVCAPLYPDELTPEIFDIVLPLDGKQIDGTSKNETLRGTDCSDAIVGDVHINFAGDGVDDEAPCNEGMCSDDTILGFGANDLLVGDKTVLGIGETGGNDTIHGGDGDDFIIGDAAFIGDCSCGGDHAAWDVEDALGGDDFLYGDDGNDVLLGDALEGISGSGYGGNDYLNGGNGDDFIVGDALGILDGGVGGNDALYGGDGDDELYGDAAFGIDGDSFAGDDDLTGGAGDDLLFGDSPMIDGTAAHDTFHFDAASDFGNDVIADAGSREVFDTIAFTGIGSTDIADLDARSTVDDDGIDVQATVFTDSTKTVQVGSILIVNIGNGSTTSWALIDGTPNVIVTVA